jgi:hypothetical protein
MELIPSIALALMASAVSGLLSFYVTRRRMSGLYQKMADDYAFLHGNYNQLLTDQKTLRQELAAAKKRPPNETAEELLHELTGNGAALIKITVVPSENVFLRSPRT